jgi:hypothetical protein
MLDAPLAEGKTAMLVHYLPRLSVVSSRAGLAIYVRMIQTIKFR